MKATILLLGIAAAAAITAPADGREKGGQLSIRNDSGSTLTCQLAKKGSTRNQKVVLRKGREWSHHATATMTLWCEPPVMGKRFHLIPGSRYKVSWDSVVDSYAIVLG